MNYQKKVIKPYFEERVSDLEKRLKKMVEMNGYSKELKEKAREKIK
jgi:hypothetical protein